MASDLSGIGAGAPNNSTRAEIIQLGLDYRLLTQFTSFVAVEERIVNDHGQPKRVDVPVEMPEGVSYEGVFGSSEQMHPLIPFAGIAGNIPQLRSISGSSVHAEASAIGVPFRDAAPSLSDYLLFVKLHRTLADIAARLESRRPLTSDQQKIVRNGKVRISVEINNRSAISALQSLGFEQDVNASHGLTLAGTIPATELAKLAASPEVIFVAPRL
jgi:hypothetical protein